MKKLGIDIGSLYLSAVIIEKDKILDSVYLEHNGKLGLTLEKIISDKKFYEYDKLGITSSTISASSENSEIKIIDSILAQTEGTGFLFPGCRNVFSIGGETFSLIMFDENGNYKEHTINSPCAAGTGSFIEQQAERLGMSAKELSEKAAGAEGKIPSIATRCSVFAKTDIIHAMQEGYSKDAIAAGLCCGISRNVTDVLVKGRVIEEPAALIGGVSRNIKIREAMQEILGKKIISHKYGHIAGAIGAALLGNSSKADIRELLAKERSRKNLRPALELRLSDYPDFNEFEITNENGVEIFLPKTSKKSGKEITIGIDIGSTSTKAVLLDENRNITGGFYTKTGGNPLEAVAGLMTCINNTFGKDKISIVSACTTGSGRKMIRELFSADMEINEITTHARAAVFLNPEVDTIIEIGGQDSKFTRIRNGNVYYSTMNYVCAAGTGSFIEEQAKRMNVSLEKFSGMAFHSEAPYTSDRCTVYMEKDLGVLLSENWPPETLAASVLHSVRDNYISKVVNKSPLGNFIVFQGATARNKALTAAFEQLLNKPIHVSPYCHLTGALGAALLCQEQASGTTEFQQDPGNIKIEKEICTICSNNCSLTVVSTNGSKTGWGMKCGSEYLNRSPRKRRPSLPETRFETAVKPLVEEQPVKNSRSEIKIGVPEVLYNVKYSSLWINFLKKLGFSVSVNSHDRKSLQSGKEVVNSDFCAPMILSHGYIRQFDNEKTDYIFCPAVTGDNPEEKKEKLFRKKITDSCFCYYSQYFPTIVNKLTSMNINNKLISPLIEFAGENTSDISKALYKELSKWFNDISPEETEQAFSDSLSLFNSSMQNRKISAQKLLRPDSTDRIQIVIIGRPYIAFDKVINLDILSQLEDKGTEVFWMDELDLENFIPSYSAKYLERMHWHYGNTILKTAEYCASSKNLFPVYLSCFRCSPDSFLISYVKDIMETYDKPFLVLQLDEHSSDVGYATRIEAGIQSFKNHLEREEYHPGDMAKTAAKNSDLEKDDTVLVPYLDQLVSYFWKCCFEKNGNRAVLLSADEAALNTGYKYANGGECMPLVSITGGAIEACKKEKSDPEKTYLYLPSMVMACNFPQFPVFADMALKSAGLEKLKIGLINIMSPGDILPQSLAIKILESNIIGSIIYKLYFRVKPYEIKKGKSDEAFSSAREKIAQAILAGSDLRTALAEIADEFRSIKRNESSGRKPRIGIIGDLYVKFNETVNQNIIAAVEELGGELIVPSLTEYPFHFYDADIRLNDDNPRSFKFLRIIEGRYEKIAEDLLENNAEPDFAECVALMEEYGINHYIAGETSISIGRALYFIKHNLVDAILHINPMFCCPGVVSSSIFRKIQEDFNIPIIDIFYDGTGSRNKVIVPHLHYLKKSRTSEKLKN